MGLGEKLQRVHQKVNTKLGTQDGSVTFRTRTNTANSDFGEPYTATSNTDVAISTGLKLSRVKAHEVDGSGLFKVGDLKLSVPVSLLTEAQLIDSEIIYNSKSYSIVDYRPSEIYSEVAVNWLIVARVSPNG